MNMLSIIGARRDAKSHSSQELRYLANGAANGSIPDYQLAAWLMAAVLNPLNADETAWLTQAMAQSGETLDLAGLPKPWVDKHSTGGVGDKTTIALLPLLASCGVTMVKMSGAGLGITGGTVDKLASIPGFRMDLSPDEMRLQAGRIGIAITGQTPKLAPADKALYALRDVTGTVKSIPLIASSILSKKLAGGAETVVIDIKVGCGGFMASQQEAEALAAAMAEVADRTGLNLRIAMTDMESPLGRCIGNALEVREAMELLQGSRANRFSRLCMELAGFTLEACGAAPSIQSGREMAENAVKSGQAYAKFLQWVDAQGGDVGSGVKVLPTAPEVLSVTWNGEPGMVRQIRADKVGQAVVDLGGGRKKKGDAIDLSVGIEMEIEPGSRIKPGETIAMIHAQTADDAAAAAVQVREAIVLGDTALHLDPILRLN